MINFRFHIVSIVAVFLALSVGIALGSGFIGDSIIKGIERNLASVRDRNVELQAEIDELEAALRDDQRFIEEAETYLTSDRLAARDVVVLTVEGTADQATEAAVLAVEQAGGDVVTRLTVTAKLALRTDAERAELATVLDIPVAPEDEMRSRLAERLGGLLADAAGGRDEGAADLANRLQDAGYIAIDQRSDGAMIPARAAFVVAVGNGLDAPFGVAAFVLDLLPELSAQDGSVVVAEPSDAAWGVVVAVRDEARDLASTVDHVELVRGQVALTLALERAIEGETGHYGTGPGADEVIPPHTE